MTRETTLAAALWPARSNTVLRAVALLLLGTLLLALAAKLRVPFWPVPMTMQTFMVLLIGATYGFRLATATVAVYLLEGAVGLPVFTSGAGLVYMTGPTGGYLVGYLVAAALLGAAAHRGVLRTLPGLLAVMLLADLVLFAFGFGWLAALIGPAKAWTGGVLPFLPAEALKIGLAAALVRAGWWAAPKLG